MPDWVEKFTDAQADKLEKKIKKVYSDAAIDVGRKIDSFLDAHKVKAARKYQQLQAGEITKAEYESWMKGQVFQGERWKAKLKEITNSYVHADERAREMLGGIQKDVFLESANRTAYEMWRDGRNIFGGVDFDIYDRKTVDKLIKDNPKMLPEWEINEKKDYVWNESRVQNAITQGIIQGESVSDVGRRLTVDLSASNAAKMDMFVRTALNGAQNAGRIERMREAEEMGIEVKKQWLATLDNRTRDTHRELDGKEAKIDEPFIVDGDEIDYPGDPSAPPELVYNCRCTLKYIYPKYKNMQNKERRDQKNDTIIQFMSYKEWKAGGQ